MAEQERWDNIQKALAASNLRDEWVPAKCTEPGCTEWGDRSSGKCKVHRDALR